MTITDICLIIMCASLIALLISTISVMPDEM